nr:hypothetical protein [Candidatus Sigynarchaeota archaeon]
MSEQSTQTSPRFLPADDPKFDLLMRPSGHDRPLLFQEDIGAGA